ncbi:MAG: sigma-70 family RNA polymerase sigma factor [Bacteroidia bacterium]|nr:sigma-70 family RNA polymerase sigma factor [Bacteroidia bacterium]
MVKFQIFQQLRRDKLAQKYVDRFHAIQLVSDTEEKLYLDELRTHIEQQLKSIAPRCREIFMLSRFENLSNQEIADHLGISHQTVKNQIARAVQHLRHSLNLSNESISILSYLFLFWDL